MHSQARIVIQVKVIKIYQKVKRPAFTRRRGRVAKGHISI
jgi:hypothetical protein